MKKLSRVTISLPTDLLTAVEEKLALEDENRSETFRRLLEQALKDAKEKADVEQYLKAWRDDPPTEEEFGWSDIATLEAMKDLPWEPTSEAR